MAENKRERYCGLCQVKVEGSFEDHVASKEHQDKLKAMGGMDSIIERRMSTDRLRMTNPGMAKVADRLFDNVSTKMENLLTGKKGYNVMAPDNLEKQDGFIDRLGQWYSCDPVYHEEFAYDFTHTFEMKDNIDDYKTKKDYLVDYKGWVCVTVGLSGNCVLLSKLGITHPQRKTLKKWFIKFKKPFRIEGKDVNDEFHDFFEETR